MPRSGVTVTQGLQGRTDVTWADDTLDPNKLTKGSALKAHFRCNRGHEFIRSIHQIVSKGRGCPTCGPQTRRETLMRKGVPSVADILAKRRDIEWLSNDIDPHSITRSSTKRAKFKCGEGHEWTASVADVIGKG